jgi:hypothetical protein
MARLNLGHGATAGKDESTGVDDGATLEQRQGRRSLYALKIGSRGAVFWTYGIGRDTSCPSKTAREMLARKLDQ